MSGSPPKKAVCDSTANTRRTSRNRRKWYSLYWPPRYIGTTWHCASGAVAPHCCSILRMASRRSAASRLGSLPADTAAFTLSVTSVIAWS